MPGAGGGVISLRQIFFLLLVVSLTVFLVRQVTRHALLAAIGGIMFVVAIGIYVFYPSRKGYGRPSRVQLDVGMAWTWVDADPREGIGIETG